MKYLNRLFFSSSDDRARAPSSNQANSQSSATLTRLLYSKIFIPEYAQAVALANQPPGGAAAAGLTRAARKHRAPAAGPPSKHNRELRQQTTTNRSTSSATFHSQLNQVTLLSGEQQAARAQANEPRVESGAGLGGYLLTATIGKTQANAAELLIAGSDDQQLSETFARLQADCNSDSSDSDWILINEEANLSSKRRPHSSEAHRCQSSGEEDEEEDYESILLTHHTQLYQMALDAKDVELIKASWVPVRKSPNATGVLLFRGLFTKFPDYLKFFPQFNHLDIERMHENKRLLKHAVKVIETVTFVVDSIGDEEKTSALQTALVNLVRGHLRRNIGLAEFRNLGIVLIDFICDVNNRRDSFVSSSSSSINTASVGYNRHQKHRNQLLNKSTSDSSQSNDSETMTSALDKIRASTSPSSSSEEESYLVAANSDSLLSQALPSRGATNYDMSEEVAPISEPQDGSANDESAKKKSEAKLDTSVLVSAWTKLYGGVLDLVKHEEAAHLSEKEQNSV